MRRLFKTLTGFLRWTGSCLLAALSYVLGLVLLAGVMLVWINRHDLSALAPLLHPVRGLVAISSSRINDQGLALIDQGDPQSALAKFELVLTRARAAGDRSNEAATLANEALAYYHLGQPQRSSQLYQQALGISRAIGDRSGEASQLVNLGVLYAESGQMRLALDAQLAALANFQAAKDEIGQAKCLNAIGTLYANLGQHERSLAAYQEALLLWRSNRSPSEDLARLNEQSPGGPAIKSDDPAAQLLKQVTDAMARQRQAGEAATLLRMAGAQLAMDDQRPASDYLAQGSSLASSLGDRGLELSAVVTGSAVEKALGHADRAHELSSQGLAIARELSDRVAEAVLLNDLAEDAFRAGNDQDARELLQQAVKILREFDSLGNLVRVTYNLGQIEERQGNPEEALRDYREAMDLIERARIGAGVDSLRLNLFDQYTPVYVSAVQLLMRQGQFEESFAVSERARARTFLDQAAAGSVNIDSMVAPALAGQEQALRTQMTLLDTNLRQERTKATGKQNVKRIEALTNELADRQREYSDLLTKLKVSSPDYAALVTASPLAVADLQQNMASDATLLSYFVLPDQTVAFIITAHTFKTVTLSVTQQELSDAADEFRAFPGLDDTPPASARQLYEWLVAPLRSYLNTPTLGFIPHGILNYLPMGALYDGRSYLADSYDLFYLPSASALPLIQAKRKPGNDGSLLALAYGQAAGLPMLHYAEAEAQGVAQLYGTTAVIGAAATPERLQSAAPQARILHLAAHAELNATHPLFSRIVLAPAVNGDDSLDIAEVYALDLAHADLVVLSACQTQLGARNWGDDIVGLGRAFIYAGSPSVLASLWSVDDQATSDLMLAFYRHLRDGASKAGALRAAQSEIRTKYPNPYYWSAFTLIGDPG